MTKCLKCGGTEIVQGKVEGHHNAVFAPEGLRFLTITLNHGTMIEPRSYAYLNCGSVWSQTDPNAERIHAKHCDRPSP